MITEDQTDIVKFLSQAGSYGLPGPVEFIETHISRIFLVGDRAFKMKRAVKLPYVDFSTAGLRLGYCEKEVALNGASAPGLYLGVRPIMRGQDGQLHFGGKGEVVDAVVEMVRFDQALLADRLATAGKLTPELMTRTARMIAGFHQAAPAIQGDCGADNIAAVLSINEAGFATSHLFEPGAVRKLSDLFRDRLAIHAARLDRRHAAGKIRRCHGDLHLRNICILNGEPRLFDCIEFNDQIATVDTLYDLAFLLMDLWHRGFPHYSSLVANRYLDHVDDEDGFVLLPFFLALRAAVRAHVIATQVEEGSTIAEALTAEAKSYFSLARDLLGERQPQLIAIGGLSGSGKTTLADALAPFVGMPPGARVIESDRVRKAMHGVDAETHLPAAAYRPDISERVYREIARRAGSILKDGGTVVADAVFDRLASRELIEMAALIHNVPFTGVWLKGEPEILRERVAARKGGPSDADLGVLNVQLANEPHTIGWQSLNAAQPISELVGKIRAQANLGREPMVANLTGQAYSHENQLA